MTASPPHVRSRSRCSCCTAIATGRSRVPTSERCEHEVRGCRCVELAGDDHTFSVHGRVDVARVAQLVRFSASYRAPRARGAAAADRRASFADRRCPDNTASRCLSAAATISSRRVNAAEPHDHEPLPIVLRDHDAACSHVGSRPATKFAYLAARRCECGRTLIAADELRELVPRACRTRRRTSCPPRRTARATRRASDEHRRRARARRSSETSIATATTAAMHTAATSFFSRRSAT